MEYCPSLLGLNSQDHEVGGNHLLNSRIAPNESKLHIHHQLAGDEEGQPGRKDEEVISRKMVSKN